MGDPTAGSRWRDLAAWFAALGGGLALFVAGAATMALAAFTGVAEAVGVAMTLAAAGLMALGVLGHRLEGPVEMGAQGLKAQLARLEAERVAAEKGLSPQEARAAVEDLRRDLQAVLAELSPRRPSLADMIREKNAEREEQLNRQAHREARRRLIETYFEGWSDELVQRHMRATAGQQQEPQAAEAPVRRAARKRLADGESTEPTETRRNLQPDS
ncbi:MAG TPA: hypothetical protein VK992_03085 [Candidatus Caenarcaniphilales bacterium]|nr:hypothetical protein [Candidatus Caenarcaniphilales bacterium]